MSFKLMLVLSLILISFRTFSESDDNFSLDSFSKDNKSISYFSENAAFFGLNNSYQLFLKDDLIKKVFKIQEISIDLPRKFQGYLPTCASCVSSILYQWYYCKKNKIKDCASLSQEYQVSTFFMKQFATSYYILNDSDLIDFQKGAHKLGLEILNQNKIKEESKSVLEFIGLNYFDLTSGSFADKEFKNLKKYSTKNPGLFTKMLSEACANTAAIGNNYSQETMGDDANMDLKTIHIALAEHFFILSRYLNNKEGSTVLKLKNFCPECFVGIKQISSTMLSKNLNDDQIFILSKSFASLFDYNVYSQKEFAITYTRYNWFVANKIISTIALYGDPQNCFFKGKLDTEYIVGDNSAFRDANKADTLNIILKKIESDIPVIISVCNLWKMAEGKLKCSTQHQIIVLGYKKILDIKGNERYLFKINECSNKSSREWFLADAILDNTIIEFMKPSIFWIE